jgi:predicted O-methyltransferase YrrM
MTIYNDEISAYINSLFVPEDAALRRAREDSPNRGLPAIQIKPEEGRFLQFLVRACGAQKALEIGALGGYSGIWIGRGLPPGGKLITLEVEPLHAQVAGEHFAAAGVAQRIEIRVGNAHELLKALTAEGPFDFIFIDAEKTGYPRYLDWALENVRLNGVIAVHNAFRKGSVAGLAAADKFTATMQEFNHRFAAEPTLISTVFPAGDGMLVGVKVSE